MIILFKTSEVLKLSFCFGTSRGTKQKIRLKTVPTTLNCRYIRIVFFWVNACHLLEERLFTQTTRFLPKHYVRT